MIFCLNTRVHRITKISEVKTITTKNNKLLKTIDNERTNNRQNAKDEAFWNVKGFKSTMDTQTTENLTNDEVIAMLIQSEWEDRHNRSMDRGIKNAKFRYKSTIEALDFNSDRLLDKNQIHRLAECTFLKKAENLLITGSTGTGKSFIACAIGNQACMLGYKVIYANVTKLFTQLKIAKADSSVIKEMARLEKQDLLILDDFGIQPFDNQSRMILMEIIEDGHGKRSTLITSQLPVNHWYEIIGDQTLADAILDRVVHDAHRLELIGESLRKKEN
jgi:DNA replication protein DnaC